MTSSFEEIAKLEEKLLAAQVPGDLLEKAKAMIVRIDRLAKMGGQYAAEFDAASRYVDWITNLPWNKRSDDVLDLENARKILHKNHYGLDEVKDKIIEYLAVLQLNKNKEGENKFNRAPILMLVGLVGTGKTTLAYSIADAMNRKFVRIPFGGIGDALYLRGQSRAYPDAEPGAIIKALRQAGTRNPVILLDEIDRVADDARSTIMGVLVELLDPEQNFSFSDHYIDFPFNLSEVLFIATANNTTNISTAVLDRLEPIGMPSYSDLEKITIGRDFVLPRAIKSAGIPEGALLIDENVWPTVVRPLGYDAGIRTLERTIDGIVRKVAKMIVEGKGQTFKITPDNIKEFLPA